MPLKLSIYVINLNLDFFYKGLCRLDITLDFKKNTKYTKWLKG